ncbi:hypothetical protein PHYBOEH_005799 [Phytophthora boehmeriae]|uniref:Uncharacterized protein n=1 Tax=Phytophthora boehmeriae TaxID=109152 RepID=A0A8T1X525_9STRA|nr:hypothetical protein PHYBOEH_005799 [Phytophthora boehmeriae]
MKLPLPSDFFAPVRLSPSEVHDLQQVEARLLTGYLTQYDAYCTRQDEDSHEDVWKLVGQRFGVKIFSQKPKKSRRRHRREQEQLPALRLVGSVDGTLEDILYGSMWRSGRERAARAHFTRDGVADGAVLCTVEKPSPVEPFRSLSVKWMLKRAPHGGLVVKDRDFCYLAASGVVHSPKTGRKLGFRTIAQWPPGGFPSRLI